MIAPGELPCAGRHGDIDRASDTLIPKLPWITCGKGCFTSCDHPAASGLPCPICRAAL